MHADRALDFAAPAEQAAQSEVQLDCLRIDLDHLDERFDGLVGLLIDEEVEAAEVRGRQRARFGQQLLDIDARGQPSESEEKIGKPSNHHSSNSISQQTMLACDVQRWLGPGAAEMAGEPRSAEPPVSVIKALILGSARAALISALSFSTISTGVALGTPSPHHETALYPGTKTAHAWDVRQRFQTLGGSNREGTQPAGRDVLRSRGSAPNIN